MTHASPDKSVEITAAATLPPAAAQMFREAVAALQAGSFDQAESLLKSILEHVSAHIHSEKYLALCYFKQQQFGQAEAAYRRITSVLPDDVDALFGLASSVHEAGRLSEAVAAYRVVLARDPNHVASLHNMANALRDAGNLDEAIRYYRKALGLKPDHHACALNYSAALFFLEDWSEAWRAFESRLAVDRVLPALSIVDPKTGKTVTVDYWRAGPQPKSLLVISEQGLGDSIQFARFLPELVRTGTTVTLMTDRKLFRLLDTLEGPISFVARNEQVSVSNIQAWAPLLSLPLALGLRPGGLTPKIPYLTAEPERVARWRARIGGEGLKVGIAWQGNPAGDVDRGRSIPLSLFVPLAQIRGVRLISLQKGPGEEQIAQVPFAGLVETLGPEFDAGPDAFLDSAAALVPGIIAE
jgi:tetratricopeptide (TPR) repeat protein